MNALKAIAVGLMLVILVTAVPVAAIALDYGATSDGGTASSASNQAAVTVPAPKAATLVIRHQKAHCHAWSLNGDAFAADQLAQLAVGDSIKRRWPRWAQRRASSSPSPVRTCLARSLVRTT